MKLMKMKGEEKKASIYGNGRCMFIKLFCRRVAIAHGRYLTHFIDFEERLEFFN